MQPSLPEPTHNPGRMPCVGVDDEVWVEDEVHGREAETPGETQTHKGVCVSPAPEREREKRREKKVVGEHTKQSELTQVLLWGVGG